MDPVHSLGIARGWHTITGLSVPGYRLCDIDWGLNGTRCQLMRVEMSTGDVTRAIEENPLLSQPNSQRL